MATTFHTYPDLLYARGRLAATAWLGASAEQAVVSTLRYDPDAIILRVEEFASDAVGYAPGGIAA